MAAFDLAAGKILCIGAEAGGYFDLRQIQDGIAAGAEEVDMGCGVGVKSLGAIYGAYAEDQALLFEKSQIAVNCCLRDVRMGLLQHLVNHLSGRVGVCVHQTIENRVALAELLGCCSFHRHLPFMYLRVILVYT